MVGELLGTCSCTMLHVDFVHYDEARLIFLVLMTSLELSIKSMYILIRRFNHPGWIDGN